jgi:hypothetical protein
VSFEKEFLSDAYMLVHIYIYEVKDDCVRPSCHDGWNRRESEIANLRTKGRTVVPRAGVFGLSRTTMCSSFLRLLVEYKTIGIGG